MAVDGSAKPYSGPMLIPTGQYAGTPAIRLHRPVYLIGSRSDARIHLVSSTVSRAHALLVQTRHETYIRDLASRTHVFVNGKQVYEGALEHGDLLGIGKFTFEYQANHVSHGKEPPVLPATLLVAGAETPIPIEGRVVLIGRRAGSDIPLTEDSVSSTHAVIFQWEGLRFIRDLGSRTGTFVNGHRIHEIQLNPNDAIRIGETDITYAPSLEEAAFDLIADASDSLIDRSPIAEEIDLGLRAPAAAVAPAEARAEAAKPAAAEPIQPLAEQPPPLVESPLELAPLEPPQIESAPAESAPAESAPLEVAPIASAPAEDLPPLPLEIDQDLLAPEPEPEHEEHEAVEPPLPVEQVTETRPQIDDLIDLAKEESAAAPSPAPHDTAHIPLAVEHPEESTEPAAEHVDAVAAEGAAESAPTPFDQIDVASTPESEDLVDAIPLADSSAHEIAASATETGEPAPADAQGLDLLEESADAPQAEEIADADLPRRGWRSATSEPLTLADIAVEPSAEPQSAAGQPADDASVPEPQRHDDAIDLADEPTSSAAPIISGDAVIDTSALTPIDDHAAEPVESAPATSDESPDVDAKAAAPQVAPDEIQPAEAPAADEQIPSEIVPDEFIPSGEVSDEDFPVDDDESLSSFKARRQLSRQSASRSRRRKADRPEDETIDLTEPTPQSALDLPPIEAAAPAIPAMDVTENLSDTTFSRAVEEFEGDNAGPIVESPDAISSESSQLEPDQKIEPIAFAEEPPEAVAPNFDADVADEDVLADEVAETADESSPADSPIFDAAAQLQESLPPSISPTERIDFERPTELASTDLLGLEDKSPAQDDAIPSAPAVESLDLSKLEPSQASPESPPIDGAAALDLLTADPSETEPPILQGQATTDSSSEPHPPQPSPDESIAPGEVAIEGAGSEGFEANQMHYLGGEPLSLKEGVHPPAGFGQVSVDFSQPPTSEPPGSRSKTDETKPEPAPAALSSLTAIPTESDTPVLSAPADPFAADQQKVARVEIPPFGTTPPTEPPAMRIESDAPLRSVGRKRRARVIRNGFGQNPGAPKAGKMDIPPFADNIPGLAGKAMEGLAIPAGPDLDVFGDTPSSAQIPPADDRAQRPRTLGDLGRATTTDAWISAVPQTARSRRKTSAVAPVAPADAQSELGSVEILQPMQPQPAIVLEDENTANAAAQRRARLLRRVPILCGVMVLLIGAAIAACAFFTPVTQEVQATMAYRNLDYLTHEEQLHFQADQDRKLHLDSTRTIAIAKLQNRHPDIAPGFLLSPQKYQSMSLEWPETRAGEPGVAWVNYQSADKQNDPARVEAVALAMFEVNADLATAAQRLKQSMDQLASDIASETRQSKEINDQIEHERAIQDGQPTLAELAKLKADDATLEAAYADAMKKAKDAQADIDQLNKEHAADAKPASNVDPVATDAQIQQMSKDADALSVKIAAARKERADLAAKARETLDAAYDQFKKQVQGAGDITKNNPQLAAYVTAAQNLQQAIHQLTDEYIQKQQDEYKQLNDFKNSMVAKIEQRQADLFASDPQLKQLNDEKEITTRKYNEAINSGLDKEAADQKNALALIDTAIKARRDIIANDPVYNDLITGLQHVIDQKQSSIEDQRKKTDEQLATMKEAFDKSAPTVEQLPAEQKQLAAAMQQKLEEIDAARKQYAEAAAAAAGDADTSVQKMVADLQALQTNIETRKRQVADANSDAARKVRDDAYNSALAKKTAQLDQLNKAVASAQADYLANHNKLLNAQSAAEEASASAERLEQAIRKQQQLHADIGQHQAEWDQKNAQFGQVVEPLEPEAQAHLVGSPIDNRVMYAGISSLAILLAFLIAICWTVISAARESHHAYTPSFETLETSAPKKANGNGQFSGPEPEENEAAVA